MNKNIPPFHLAIPVHNIEACRVFYRDILGCKEGRSDAQWVDLNFFGHQLVIHTGSYLLHSMPPGGGGPG